jgi:hypothetical protein
VSLIFKKGSPEWPGPVSTVVEPDGKLAPEAGTDAGGDDKAAMIAELAARQEEPTPAAPPA